MLQAHELIVLAPLFLLLVVSIILTVKTRFIQVRAIPRMYRLLHHSLTSTEHSAYTIKAHKALFTAMSTTIGITNIVGPLIAIGFGGPGALLGYLLATIFGAASTFAEVTFAQKYKDPAPLAERTGGPMHYMNQVFHPAISTLYAISGATLLIFWSGSQANAIASILAPYNIPHAVTGALLAISTLGILVGGVKRVSAVAEKMVPFMFLLYTGSTMWIIGANIGNLPATIKLIFTSAFEPATLGGGLVAGGIINALRWGLARGYQSNESGIGTATVPHSMAEAESPVDQGILSIVSVFSNGILCLLSGIAVLITNMHLEYDTDGIALITKLFGTYFPRFGPGILLTCALLFAISTLIGNGFNGSNFFGYALGKRHLYVYYVLCASSIFINSMVSVDTAWGFIDYLALPVFVPHALALLVLSFARSTVLDDRSE